MTLENARNEQDRLKNAGSPEKSNLSGVFWLLWAAVSFPVLAVGIWLSFLVYGSVSSSLASAGLNALIGAGIGGLQALLLRGRLSQLRWWVLVSGAGWSLGFSLADSVLLRFSGLAIGVSLGFLQWLVLSSNLRRAGWWVLASALAWGLGWFIAGPVVQTSSLGNLTTVLVIALFPAVAGGLTMAWLLVGGIRPGPEKGAGQAV
jgi:hypothetical protein